MKDHPLTRELRRELREASLRQNDAKAFEVLEKILKIDPGDSDALAQKKEVGKRLSDEHFEDLPELLEQGNFATIRQMVENLRRWTDEQSLARFPGYREAAAMVDADYNSRNRATLSKMLANVALCKDIRCKMEKAKEVEEFAAENRVILPDEQLRFLAKVHEEWLVHLESEKRLEQVNAWAEEVEAIEAQAETMGGHMEALAVRDIMARLDQIQEGASTYQDVPENEELMRRAKAVHARLTGELKQRSRRRRIHKTAGSALSITIVCVVGLVIYAYSTLDRAIAELAEVHSKKQIWKAEEVCARKSFMGHVYSVISQEYVAVYNACAKWHQEYTRDMKKFAKMRKEVLTLSKQHNIGYQARYAAEICNLIQLGHYVCDTYGMHPWPTVSVELPELLKPLRVTIDEATEAARGADNDDCFDILFDAYKHCANLGPVSKVCGDEELASAVQEATQTIQRLFMERCVALSAKTPALALACFDRYAADMELPGDWRKSLEGQKYFQDTLTGLMNCTTLESYISQLKKIQPAYNTGTACYPLSQMEKIQKNARGIAIRMALPQKKISLHRKIYSDLPAHLKEVEAIQKRLQVPYEGKRIEAVKLIYEAGYNSAVGECVSKMTVPIKKRGTILKTPNRIYFGEVSAIGDYYFVKEYDKSGNIKEEQRLEFSKSTCKKLDKLREEISIEKMGITGNALARGMVIPGDLLARIAKYNNNSVPVKYKAYLFFHAVRWLELLRGKELTGLEFSPCMQGDLAEFKKIARSMDVESEGCWYVSISVGEEKSLVDFFRKAASHNYSEEILKNVEELNSFSLTFVGYIDEDRKAVFTRQGGGTVYYFPRVEEDDLEVATYATGTANIAPYTPLFTLTR